MYVTNVYPQKRQNRIGKKINKEHLCVCVCNLATSTKKTKRNKRKIL